MKATIKKISVAVISILAVLVTAHTTYAWGPERPTFTMEKPATYPTFNSITNNPTIGDERNFVRIAEKGVGATYSDEVKVVPGKEYEVYIYFHNNASATFNDLAHKRSGIALQTKLSTAFSALVAPDKQGLVTAAITSTNANPKRVWDEARMVSDQSVKMRYKTGSAKIYSDWGASGSVLATSLFSEGGTYVGLNRLDGVIPGCEEYHGVVVYTLVAEQLAATIDKTVSLDGKTFVDSVNGKTGDEVTYKIVVKNTGNTALSNLKIWDVLPAKMSIIKGSVRMYVDNAKTPQVLDDTIVAGGYNLGTVGAGRSTTIIFKAKVGAGYECNVTSLSNVANLTFDGNEKKINDAAEVKISHGDECKPVEPEPGPEPYVPEEPKPVKPSEPKPQKPVEPTPNELPETGPAEIAMAVVVLLGIAGAGYYLYKTRRTLRTVEKVATGKMEQAETYHGDEVNQIKAEEVGHEVEPGEEELENEDEHETKDKRADEDEGWGDDVSEEEEKEIDDIWDNWKNS